MHYHSDEKQVKIEPQYNLVFNDAKGEVGRLEFDKGQLVFKGDVDQSTQCFLDFLLESFNGKVDSIVNDAIEDYVRDKSEDRCG
jgi:hypothetical protein